MVMWLSFANEHGSLGVTIVEIDDDDIARATVDVEARFPAASPKAPLIIAATVKAFEMGANPGGEVLGTVLADPSGIPPDCYNRLLQRDELVARGLAHNDGVGEVGHA